MTTESDIESFFRTYKEDNPNEHFTHHFSLPGRSSIAQLEIRAKRDAFPCTVEFQKAVASALSGYKPYGEMQISEAGEGETVYRLQYKKDMVPLSFSVFSMRRMALLLFICIVVICVVCALYVRRDLLVKGFQDTNVFYSIFSGSAPTPTE